MRVLQIHNRYREEGGEDAVVASEAELLRSAGHEVVQYLAENPGSRLRAAGALALSAWNPAAARRVRVLAERDRPDVAHVHNTWFSLSPAVFHALRQAGVPVVATLHNYRLLCCNGKLFREGEPCELCVGSHPWRGVRHRCYRGSAMASGVVAGTTASHRALRTWDRQVDVFLTLTGFARELFLRGGLPAERMLVKPNSVPDPGARANPPSASQTVLYVGRLSEEKGILQLLDCWREAPPPGLELLIVGDGPLRREVEDRSLSRVRVAGRLATGRVRELMLSARALVFPSVWYEGQPMVVLEALAAGLPVLASDLGGTAATLRGMGREWLIQPGDRSAWQTGLAHLGGDTVIDRAGLRARALYEQAFTPERSLLGLETAYRRARERFPIR
jgi:glycosyltransferase involved in cell wall biosynthesis